MKRFLEKALFIMNPCHTLWMLAWGHRTKLDYVGISNLGKFTYPEQIILG